MVTNTWLAVLLLGSIVLSFGSLSVNFGLFGGAPQGQIQPGLLPITGQATGTASATVASVVSITLPVSTVSLGSLNNNDNQITTDFVPAPFTVGNDGTVNINLTINATDLFTGTSAANPSSFYQFNATLNETGSVVNATVDFPSTTFTNMPATGSPATLATRLKFANANDLLNIHINITVPSDEPAGAKSSTITVTASQA